MKTLLIALILFPTFCFGQTINTTGKKGERNIYNDAIKRYTIFAFKSNKSSNDTLFILKDDWFIYNLQTTIQKSRIVFVETTDISRKLQNENSFVALKVFPLRFDNGHFQINIVPFIICKDKEEVILQNTGTYTISYRYECKTMSFKFYRSDFNGI
jgi:hypothetical protein